MKRDWGRMASERRDVLVVGGGIYGAFIAWDASQRGLNVALIDRGDFGGETSSNSLKVVHGGLRYLQDVDLSLIRRMVGERKAYLRIAPHLVHPLPFLLPTRGFGLRSRPALTVALKLNDLLSFDRNRGQDPGQCLPGGTVLGREACLGRLGGLVSGDGISGGALWYDAQIENTERMVFAALAAAVESGACLANYVQAESLLEEGGRVVGVFARDRLADQTSEIRAELVINAAGPWIDRVAGEGGGTLPWSRFKPSLAMNLVTRQLLPDLAFGISTRAQIDGRPSRLIHNSPTLFVVPWREFSLIGTAHLPYGGPVDAPRVREEDVEELLQQVNLACPPAQLERSDVLRIHRGLLPAEQSSSGETVQLIRDGEVFDHEALEGRAGLISVLGVKFTTARALAEAAVDLAMVRLARAPVASRTATTPVHGGGIRRFDDYLQAERDLRPAGLDPEVLEHLIRGHGSEYRRVVELVRSDPALGLPVVPGSCVTRAEVVYAVRYEMAQTLADVLLRRTELGSAGYPGEACLRDCAELMAPELGWDRRRVQRELEETNLVYGNMTA